tara:strand:- start:381 stop:506 length:126 start_codon:yes stop_codon:yes gene_type:complete
MPDVKRIKAGLKKQWMTQADDNVIASLSVINCALKLIFSSF